LWSSPDMSGDRPPPCEKCTLTAIDPFTLLMFGGYTGKKYFNDIYILDFAAMVCVCVMQEYLGKCKHHAIALAS